MKRFISTINMRLYKLHTLKTLFFFITFVVTIFFLKANGQGYNIEVSPGKSNLTIEAGKSFTQKFRIGNYSGAKRTLYIYVQDFTVVNEQGTPTFFENDLEGEESRRFALSSWVQLPFDSIELDNNQVAEVEAIITVPQDAEAGGHYGAFFVQTEQPDQQGTAVSSIGRIASLMLVNVPGDIQEKITILEATTDKKVYTEENPKITFTTLLKNEGNVHGIPVGAFSITGGFGSKTKSVIFNQDQGAVLPGTPERRISESFTLSKHEGSLIPPIGKFSIDLISRYGTSNLPLETTVFFWLLPIKFIAVAALVIVVGAFLIYRALVSFKK